MRLTITHTGAAWALRGDGVVIGLFMSKDATERAHRAAVLALFMLASLLARTPSRSTPDAG